MMVLHARRRPRELLHELVVDQKALGEGPQVRVGHAAEHVPQAGRQPVDIDVDQRQEVFRIDLAGECPRHLRGNDLHGPLVHLGHAFHAHVVAVLERAIELLAWRSTSGR